MKFPSLENLGTTLFHPPPPLVELIGPGLCDLCSLFNFDQFKLECQHENIINIYLSRAASAVRPGSAFMLTDFWDCGFTLTPGKRYLYVAVAPY